ncbi:MAG: hypothetical protein ACK4WH_15190 [Phycisphaerales bacterium]
MNHAVEPIPDALPTIRRGVCCVMFVFDLAFAIDLDHVERILKVDAQREILRPSRKSPSYFEYTPAPLRVSIPAQPIRVAGFSTQPSVEVLVFDFGAALVSFRIPLTGSIRDLVQLSAELPDQAQLASEAREHADAFCRRIAEASRRPGLTPHVEDYFAYQIEEAEFEGSDCAPSRLVELAPGMLAQILRGEVSPMSADQIEDALRFRLSYGPDDAAIIDWNAALLLDREAEDIAPVLEYANVELLEMRVLDDRLDESLDEAYRASQSAPTGLRRIFPASGGGARRIAQLQVDSAILFEGVNNALKLTGDQYLARLYRLAAQRFHLPDRDATIERKLQTLQSISSTMHDDDSARRIETLEWIIIILIAFEIVMGLYDRLIA